MSQSLTPAQSLDPAQLRRRVVDFDAQIRQGVEEGNVREVVRRLGTDLVSKKKILQFSLANY
jgi:hypothetical protein